MKFSALVLASTFSVLGLTASSPALAHIQLVAPTPRVANDPGIKNGPCGPALRSSTNVTTARPGETVTVEWTETISHPGYFRILFDESGQDGFTPPTPDSFKLYNDYFNKGANVATLAKLVVGPVKATESWVLADNWGLHPGGAKRPWSLKVVLPNVTCNTCTLQLVQGMFDPGRTYGSAYYYHCADFILKGDPVPATDGGTTPTADAGVAPGTGGAGGAGQGGQGGTALNSGGQGGKASGGSAGGSAGQGGSLSSGGDSGGGGEGGNAGSADNSDKSSGGCSLARRHTGVASLLLSAAVAAFLVRRRRR